MNENNKLKSADSGEQVNSRLSNSKPRRRGLSDVSGKRLSEPAKSSAIPTVEKDLAKRIRTSGNVVMKPSDSNNKYRPCDKSSCTKRPTCFARASDRCTGDKWTSRWYHISFGEHFCNDCYDNFYRSNKDGYEEYVSWKRVWSANAKSETCIKTFLVDQHLPFWLQCTTCNKWRQLPRDTDVTPSMIRSFKCERTSEKDGKIGCETEEDEHVSTVAVPSWINMLLAPPYMIRSPARPFVTGYRLDSVGISPMVSGNKSLKSLTGCHGDHSGPDFIRPFNCPDGEQYPLGLDADSMTLDEQRCFPQYAGAQQMYLAIRNIVISLWAINPKEVLTESRCAANIICRGLARIRCLHELPSILRYLSYSHYINVGVFNGPTSDLFSPESFKQASVIIIGAGSAGLGAANQLRISGAKVTVLEARGRIGGRLCDEQWQGNICVARGTQLIDGCINNPFAVLCHQLGMPLVTLSDHCMELTDSGEVVHPTVESRMEFHFEALLDRVALWKKCSKDDASLLEKLVDASEEFISKSGKLFTNVEENLFQFHLSSLEHACGASLEKISAMNYDQSDLCWQSAGPLCFLPQGYISILDQLAKNIDIKLNTPVASVDYSKASSRVSVSTCDGDVHEADYVLVTVPLAVLKRNTIKFTPPLPRQKTEAIQSFGIGVLEKVVLHFSRRFWAAKTDNANFFGRVPSGPESRGLFTVFHDISSKVQGSIDATGVLVTFLSAEAAKIVHQKSDREIIEMCVCCLRNLFPSEVSHINPINYIVTRWQEDPYAGMSYGYIPVGCSSDVFDQLAEPVNDQIFFAGEATNRSYSQTVTGAYLSGLREVRRIMSLMNLSQHL